MQVQANTNTREVFIKFDDGATIDVRLWSPRGDTGYLKDGETVEFNDWCTATRMGSFVMWTDPGIHPSPKRQRLARQAKERRQRRRQRRTKH